MQNDETSQKIICCNKGINVLKNNRFKKITIIENGGGKEEERKKEIKIGKLHRTAKAQHRGRSL